MSRLWYMIMVINYQHIIEGLARVRFELVLEWFLADHTDIV